MKSKKITKSMGQKENVFDRLSKDWWKIDGSFSALHAFNFIRIKFIKEKKILIEGDNKEYSSKSYENEYSLDQVLGKVIFKF